MPKSEDKYVVKVFNWSEFHLSEMTLLQNPYFRCIHGFMSNLIKKSWTDSNHASIGTATPEKTASKKSSNHKVVKMLNENISDKGAILLDK